MKNFAKFGGIITFSLVLCFAFVSCNDGGGETDAALNGTWVPAKEFDDYFTITFNNGNFENTFENKPYQKGTYSADGEKLVRTTTHQYCVNYEDIEDFESYCEGWLGPNYGKSILMLMFGIEIEDKELYELEDEEFEKLDEMIEAEIEKYLELIDSLEPKYYTKNELTALGFGDSFIEWFFWFGEDTRDYFIEDNVLIIVWEKYDFDEEDYVPEPVTYTRK